MAEVEVKLPRLGESVFEATVTRWLKKEGDPVREDEPIVEIATDKVDSEVPSPASGTLKKILVREGQVAQVGQPIATIDTELSQQVGQPVVSSVPHAKREEPEEPSVATIPPQQTQQEPHTPPQQSPQPDGSSTEVKTPFLSPVVMRIAQQEGISMEELISIKGTGVGGRITKKDLLAYIESKKQKGVSVAAQAPTPQTITPPPIEIPTTQETPPPSPSTDLTVKYGGPVEIVQMDRVRRLIAEHMVMSKRTSPHVSTFAEADVTELVRWRERIKADFEKKEGFKLTYTPVFVKVIARALREFPLLNSSVEDDKIIIKKFINIGVAVALPNGNLIVPVVKNADQYNLLGLARAIHDLAERARHGQLKPNEIQGGTFTLTNVGSFGSLIGTPIINQPQVAILATGVIKKRPVVKETPAGDVIAIRQMMYLSLSYDHRIIDGYLAGQFMRRVVELLENFDPHQEMF